MISHFSFFQLIKCDQIHGEWEWKPQLISEYQLIYVKKGEGELSIDDIPYFLKPGKCFLLQPGKLVKWEKFHKGSLCFYQITFQCLKLRSHRKINEEKIYQKHDQPLSFSDEFVIKSNSTVIRLIEKLYKLYIQKQEDVLYDFRLQKSFYDLLDFVFEEALSIDEDKHDTSKAIQMTINYMKKNFKEPITREKLAKLAGLSPSYYSYAFKKEIGMSPIEFLHNVRIEKAKKLLVSTNDKLKVISQNVGFNDEFYFSRIFKKRLGVSPKIYIKTYKRKIANIEFSFNGHFQALNITPNLSVEFCENKWHLIHNGNATRLKQQNYTQTIINSLLEIKPDLIICSDISEVDQETLSKIAPVYSIPWMEMEWRQHLLKIAEIIGKEKDAEKWLNHYAEKAEIASQKVNNYIQANEKIMILRVYAKYYSLYGMRNVGGVIYQDLKLNGVNGVDRIQNQTPISLEELTNYHPDYLLIMVQKDEQSKRMLELMKKSSAWSQLPAVQNQNVYFIDKNPWLEYSPIAHEMILDKAVKLFCTNERT